MRSPVHKIYPHKAGEKMVYFFGFATPLFMIPQAITIWSNESAANVSLITWIFFMLADVAWITYGVRNNIRPLVFGHSFYFLVESTVVLGILVYR